MAQYNVTNFYFKYSYSVQGIEHIQICPLSGYENLTPSSANTFLLASNDGVSTQTAQQFATAWTGVFMKMFNPADVVSNTMEFYYHPDNLDTPLLMSATSTALNDGLTAGTTRPASQVTLTFRDALGKTFKIIGLGTIYAPFDKKPINDASTDIKAIADFVTDTPSYMLSRANNPVIVQRNYCLTYNDALTQRLYGVH